MKRKLLCIAVAVIMILPLAFAAIPTASAAVAEGWDHTASGGASAGNFAINSDGSLTMGWGNPAVTWANLGALYDASAYNNNYTVTVEAYLPKTQSAAATNGVPVISVMAAFADGVDKNWIPGMALKLTNYEGTASGTPENLAAWGTYNVAEMFDNLNAVACAASPYSTIGLVAGDWNTVKIVNNNGVVTIWVNDVCICVDYAVTFSTGNYIVLGSNGDCGDWNNMPSFRNFKIVSNDDSVADYTAYTVTEEAYPVVTYDIAETNWSVLTPFLADGAAPNGVVTCIKGGYINLNSNTGWHGQAGVVYNDKLFASNLSVTINKTANTLASPNAHTDFIISATKPTQYSLQMSVNTYFPDCNPATALAIHVGGDNLIYGSGTVGAIVFNNTWTNDTDNTFSLGTVYEVDGEKFVKIYLNGVALQVEEIDEETEKPTGAYVDYEFNVTDILDENNQVYVVVGQTGYGTSGATANFKAINGVSPYEFEGADAYYEAEENKASTPVVQWRAPEAGVAAGLRFKTTVALNSVNHNDSIEKMGTLIIPADKLGDADLVLSADGKANGITYLDIVAKNYYEKTDAAISFTAVLTGIPDTALDRDFVAVSYIAYADGTVTYGAARTISVNGAMGA